MEGFQERNNSQKEICATKECNEVETIDKGGRQFQIRIAKECLRKLTAGVAQLDKTAVSH